MRPRDERGAVAVFLGITVSLLVIVAAFAVDLGMQRVVRRDMQALADVVALDAARLLDGRKAGDVREGSGAQDSLITAVNKSVARNGSSLGVAPVVDAKLVFVDVGADGVAVPRRDGSGVLEPVADSELPDAVLVTAAGEVDFAFAPGSGAATRTALGTASSYGCFRLGSFAAALSTDGTISTVFESLVGDALGGINLRAIGYEGLMTSSIDIAALAAELGVGTPQELANLQNFKVATLLDAGAQVLSNQGDTDASLVLADIAAKMSQTVLLDIGDVLAVGNGSALAGSINALDLVGSAGIAASTVLANSNNFLDAGVGWRAPRVSGGSIVLKAVASPAQYCGPTGGGTQTAQVTLVSDFGFTLPEKVSIPGLGDLSFSTQADPNSKDATMHIDASLAGATGTLVGLTCGIGTDASPQETDVTVDTNLLTSNVSLPFRVKGTLDVSTSTLVPSSVITSLFGILQTGARVQVTLDLSGAATASISTAPSAATAPTSYSVPPLTYGQAQPSVGAGQPVSLPTPAVVLDTTGSVSVSVTTSVLGIGLTTTTKLVPTSELNLTALVDAVTSSAVGTSTATVVSNVNEALVPVSQLLGIRVAGADVIVTSPPSCGSPGLAG